MGNSALKTRYTQSQNNTPHTRQHASDAHQRCERNLLDVLNSHHKIFSPFIHASHASRACRRACVRASPVCVRVWSFTCVRERACPRAASRGTGRRRTSREGTARTFARPWRWRRGRETVRVLTHTGSLRLRTRESGSTKFEQERTRGV